MAETLTKKQQKAQAFRSKQKEKKSGRAEVVPEDVPEQDLIEDNDETADVASTKTKGNAGEASIKKNEGGEGKDVLKELRKGGKDVKGKGKAKNEWAEGEEGAAEGAEKKKSKKEIKQRFILFVGNLGYKTTREEVQAHFTEAAGNKPAVRLLTTKPDPKSGQAPKSRGIAFLELSDSAAMQQCLKLHHTSIQGRRINVELTAGGGGNTDGRKEKLKEKNERMGVQREKRAEREKEAEGEAGAADAAVPETRQRGAKRSRDDGERGERAEQGERAVEVVREDGQTVDADGNTIKIRGGRRIKAKTQDGPPAKRSRPDGGYAGVGGGGRNQSGGPQRGGYQGGGAQRGGYQGGGGQGGQRGGGGGGGYRQKFEPTGANAVRVG